MATNQPLYAIASCIDAILQKFHRNFRYIVDNYPIKRHLHEAVDESIKFIQKHLFTGIEINDIKNQEIWSIPKEAIREAVINAIVHADYSLSGAPIRIAIFDDRIEIENPGLLAIGLTVDDIISGLSKLRNRVIARVFNELGLIEQWGSGIQRIIKSCERMGLKTPSFEEIGYRFRVTLYKERVREVSITEVENKIISVIKAHGALSTNEISKHIGLTTRSVRSWIDKMMQKNLILHVSKSKTDPKRRYDLKR